MITYTLCISLESDATFGRGDGLAGAVDQEVEHDEFGLPYLRGRAIKGLLVEECANILYALERQNASVGSKYHEAADRLFGRPGSELDVSASLRIGNGCLPGDLCEAVKAEVEAGRLTRMDVLESLTDVRRQTAMDVTGKPDEHSLRATRVVLRGTSFIAHLAFVSQPDDAELALLAASVKAFRRLGTGRNRGRGRVRAVLKDAEGNDSTDTLLACFVKEVKA